MKPYDVAQQGIARTFQNIALFEGMTVLDNVMTGRLTHMKAGLVLSRRCGGARRETKRSGNRGAGGKGHRFPRDPEHPQDAGGALPYGLKKRVELARALAAEPKLLVAGRADGRNERRGERGHEPLHP